MVLDLGNNFDLMIWGYSPLVWGIMNGYFREKLHVDVNHFWELKAEANIVEGFSGAWILQLFRCTDVWLCLLLNPLHPHINVHILCTALYTCLKVMTRRIWWKIKSLIFSFWSFPLFLYLWFVIWYYKEKVIAIVTHRG